MIYGKRTLVASHSFGYVVSVFVKYKSHKAHNMSIHLWTISMIWFEAIKFFDTRWENVLFIFENIGTCVYKITWNYFPCVCINHTKHTSWVFICERYQWYLFKCWFEARFWHKMGECFIYVLKHWNMLKLLEIISLVSLFIRLKFSLCAKFGAVIIVDFYIDI